MTACDAARASARARRMAAHEGLDDPAAEAEIGWVVDLITAIRSVRAEMNIPPPTPLVLVDASDETRARASRWADFIKRLARVSEMSYRRRRAAGSVQLLVRGEVAALPLKGVIDSRPSRRGSARRWPRPTPTSSASMPSSAIRTSCKRAPEEIVDGEREKREEAEGRRAKILEALERLAAGDMTCGAGQDASRLASASCCWFCSGRWPARPTSRRAPPIRCSGRRVRATRTIEIVVVSNGYHAGVALPRATLAEFASGRGYPALIAVTQRFAAFDWIEFGWGDREFYRSVADHRRPHAAARAARAVLAGKHVRAACRRPRRRSGAGVHRRPNLCACRCRWTGFDRLLAKLDATFVPPQSGSAARSRPRALRPEPVLSGERHVQHLQGLQSLDRRPARRRRTADSPGARDLAVRPDVLSALARGIAAGPSAYIFTSLICTTGCTSV